MLDLAPYAVSVGTVFLLWLLYKVASGGNIDSLYEGNDGRPSTSKFQFLAWASVVICLGGDLFFEGRGPPLRPYKRITQERADCNVDQRDQRGGGQEHYGELHLDRAYSEELPGRRGITRPFKGPDDRLDMHCHRDVCHCGG
jgi:hypothetical protein